MNLPWSYVVCCSKYSLLWFNKIICIIILLLYQNSRNKAFVSSGKKDLILYGGLFPLSTKDAVQWIASSAACLFHQSTAWTWWTQIIPIWPGSWDNMPLQRDLTSIPLRLFSCGHCDSPISICILQSRSIFLWRSHIMTTQQANDVLWHQVWQMLTHMSRGLLSC